MCMSSMFVRWRGCVGGGWITGSLKYAGTGGPRLVCRAYFRVFVVQTSVVRLLLMYEHVLVGGEVA